MSVARRQEPGNATCSRLWRSRGEEGCEGNADSRELRRFPRCYWATEADAIQGQKAQIVQPCK